jgi:arabinan endo-1,5-alpha-L-arabinosidase
LATKNSCAVHYDLSMDRQILVYCGLAILSVGLICLAVFLVWHFTHKTNSPQHVQDVRTLSVASSTVPYLAQHSGPDTPPSAGQMIKLDTGDALVVHDITACKGDDGAYYIYGTGKDNAPGSSKQIPFWSSSDLSSGVWKFLGYVLPNWPAWLAWKPAPTNFVWAPEVAYFGGMFHIYYAISETFGKNISVIGHLTNPTLNPSSSQYKWTDRGLVVQSTTADSYNCIDPSVLLAPDGTAWLGFGSFSFKNDGKGGIQIQQLNPQTGALLAPKSKPIQIAERPANQGHAEEAPCMCYKNGLYYLFMSFDYCCWQRGKAPYKIMVGRSTSPSGPYKDRDGVLLTKGGGSHVFIYDAAGKMVVSQDGTTVTDSVLNDTLVGIGGTTCVMGHGPDKLFAHAYSKSGTGPSILRVFPLEFDSENWPLLRWR